MGITKDLKKFSYANYGAIVFFTIIIPIGLSLVITAIATPKRRLDKVPAINTYTAVPGSNVVAKTDKFLKKKVVHYSSSSGGGGGFSGGGGGGFSGGGGGGFSGGGGGRF